MATKATICVPKPENGNNIVAETVATELATAFGGSTKVDASGYWDDGERLVDDDSTLVYTIDDNIDRDKVREIAEWVERELGEESVMYTFEEVDVRFT